MARLRIKELAEAKGWNASDLQIQVNRMAAGAKLSYSALYNLWTNKTKRPNLDDLEYIAQALGVSVGELIEVDNAEEDRTATDSGTNKRAALTLAGI